MALTAKTDRAMPGRNFGAFLRGVLRPTDSPLFSLPPFDTEADRVAPVDILLIHASGIRKRGRVLKIVDSLHAAGYSVACLSKLPPGAPDARLRREEFRGATVVYAPDAHDFAGGLGRRVAASGWLRMVAHLEAALWPVAHRFAPRVIHSFDAAAIGLGRMFRDRLRARGCRTIWFHDFTEYTAGHCFGAAGDDEAWRAAVVAHECGHVRAIDHAFSVSPDVATAVQTDYRLARAPTVLLNVPRRSDFDPEAHPTVREAAALAPGTPLVVYAGGVTRLRGLHTLVAALARLDSVHAALVTENESAYVGGLLAAARSGGTAERLHILPYVAPTALASFLRDASLGVHPMVRYGNGDRALPNKLFDYIHAGLPAVVSEGTAMARLVERHGLGVTFPAEDDAALAKAIREVLANPRKSRYADALLAELSWERQETRLLAPYRAALA